MGSGIFLFKPSNQYCVTFFKKGVGDSNEYNVKRLYERHLTENMKRLKNVQVLKFTYQIDFKNVKNLYKNNRFTNKQLQ